MTYNSFKQETWPISTKGWFIGYIITQGSEIAEVRMAHPDKQTDERGTCVIVLCKDIPDCEDDDERCVLFGTKQWFKTKAEAKKSLKPNVE